MINKRKRWSERSQASLMEERRFHERLSSLESRKNSLEDQVRSLEAEKDRLLRIIEGNPAFPSDRLNDCCQRLKEKGLELETYNKRIASIREECDRYFAAERDRSGERLKLQKEMARLVDQRLKKDEEIERALGAFHKLLKERDEFSAKMSAVSKKLKMNVDLDSSSLALKFVSLPASVICDRRDWANRFLGKRDGTKPYVVYEETLLLPETLSSSGCYARGDRIDLSDEEARELLRNDRLSSDETKFLPPSIVPLELFEKASEKAKQNDTYVWLIVRDQVEMQTTARELQIRRTHEN